MSYQQARDTTVAYYQLLIFDEMLPGYVTNPAYVHEYATRTGPYTWAINTPQVSGTTVPIEFSVGAYRFGHALVRESYTINDLNPTSADPPGNNVSIFDLSHFQTGDLTGGAPLQGTKQLSSPGCQVANQTNVLCTASSDHQIEWKYFLETMNANGLDGGQTNFARQTSPTISPALFNLPSSTIAGCADEATDPVCNGSGSLIARDLARGNYDGLASGQAVAAALDCPVIPAASINPTSDAVFNTGTPLIYYVMEEAKQAGTVLGCVGSKIITQEFLRALAGPCGCSYTAMAPDAAMAPYSYSKAQYGQFTFEDLLMDVHLAPRSS
jgi:hypothetical protein